MKRLFEIVVTLQTLGGAVFFGALFVSALPVSTKVLAAIGLVFVSCAVFLLMVNQLLTAEALRTLASHSVEPDLSSSRVTAAQSSLAQISGGLRMQSAGKLGYLLIGMFAFWCFGGLVIYRYAV